GARRRTGRGGGGSTPLARITAGRTGRSHRPIQDRRLLRSPVGQDHRGRRDGRSGGAQGGGQRIRLDRHGDRHEGRPAGRGEPQRPGSRRRGRPRRPDSTRPGWNACSRSRRRPRLGDGLDRADPRRRRGSVRGPAEGRIQVAGRWLVVPPAVARAAGRRARGFEGGARDGQRGRESCVNRVRSDSDTNLAGRGRAGPEDFDEGCAAGDAEHQAECQEGKLARRQDALSSSAAGPASRSSLGEGSCAGAAGQPARAPAGERARRPRDTHGGAADGRLGSPATVPRSVPGARLPGTGPHSKGTSSTLAIDPLQEFLVQPVDASWLQCNIECQEACPVGTNCRGYLNLAAEGRFEEGYILSREPNPVAAMCSYVCSAPCERACRRGDIDRPLAIRAMKRFLVEWHEASGIPDVMPQITPREERVAVVGAGPAGIAVARELAMTGFQCDVFDSLPYAGGTMLIGVPAFRLPREAIEMDVRLVERLGVRFVYDTTIGVDITFEELQRDYDSIAITAGAMDAVAL